MGFDIDIGFATGACRQEVSEDSCANAARARTRSPRLAWWAPPRLPLPVPLGTAGQLHAVQILHRACAHGPQQHATLTHEALLARRMRSSPVADHLVQIHGRLPGG